MPIATSGGANNITSSQIVDGTITNDDVADAAAIDPSKVDGLIGAPGAIVSGEGSAAAVHSLTTVANQRVVVFAGGLITDESAIGRVQLRYNGVVKHEVTLEPPSSGDAIGFGLTYTEIPGAATANIDVVTPDGGTIDDVQISVIKIQEAAP